MYETNIHTNHLNLLEDGYFVYGLFDPKTKELRYIGVTYNLLQRYNGHIQECKLKKKSHKNNWIKSLKIENLLPEMYVIEQHINYEDAYLAEVELMEYYEWTGCDLTNDVKGGRGGQRGITKSAATRKKIGDGHRGMKHTEEAKEKNRQAHLGKSPSKETREKLRKTSSGKKHTDEAKKKIQQAATGRTHTETTKQLLRDINTGKTYSEETKQKHRDAWAGDKHPTRGKKLSKERIEKSVNAKCGKYVGINNKLFGTTKPQEIIDKILNSCKRKLSFEQILEIRRLWATGKYKQKELAVIFNTKQKHISKIINNKTGRIPSDYKPK